MKMIEDKIKEVLDKVRPLLQNDGGDIEFIKFEDGIVFVTMHGACRGCPMMSVTLNDGIKTALVNEIPEVVDVKNIN